MAEIVAETMNNYLLFDKLLQCGLLHMSQCGVWFTGVMRSVWQSV